MKNQNKLNHSAYFLMGLMMLLVGIIGCSKSDDDIVPNVNCTNWSEQFLAQANAYSEATTAYSNNPTQINCQNYKAAGLKYIDALESVIDCVPTANVAGYNEDLNQYRAEVNNINCD